MQLPIDQPDFLDAAVRQWADQYEELLELVADELIRTGQWPTASRLTRRLAREGRAVPVMTIFGSMPRALGFVENHPGRIVLLLFGLRLTRAGHPVVAGFWEALEIAIGRYRGDDDEPALTRADIAQTRALEDPYVRAVSEVVLREAPFLGSGGGGPDEDWTREITDDIVRYWDTTSPDDYLRLRAAEVLPTVAPESALDGQTRMQPASNPRPGGAAGADDSRELFISHASEDKDAIARPLADELRRRGHSVWFDEYELVLGVSLRRNIDRGLARSTIGVVILSHAFFAKPWPQRELDGLVARMTSGEENVIVPIWHQLTHSDVVAYSPPLADLLAGNSEQGVDALADQIERALERRHSQTGPTGAESEPANARDGIQGTVTSDASSTARPTAIRDAVEYLNDDARRWIYDRDYRLQSDLAHETENMSARGLLQSGIHLSALASLRRQALREYRDEISSIRRRYREVCDAAPAGSEVPHLVLDDASRETLACWRSRVIVAGMNDEASVDDPTDETREPGLREFERSGDRPQRARSEDPGAQTEVSGVYGPLVEALDDSDGTVRFNAMVALREHLVPELLPVIEPLLKDPDEYIRRYAIDYYAQLNPPDDHRSA